MQQFAPSEQAIDLLHKRYFMEGENWLEMCERVANTLADDEEQGKRFFNTIHEGYFLPSTPCLVNAGKPEGQFLACFVLPVGDSIPEIFDAIKNTAIVHKTGGGTGFNFSTLRPEGSTVKTTKGVSSGPISFMKIFDAATQQMKQGGVRRGANMGMLNIDHPDIVKFIKCKHVDKKISNFNISVAITDKFMEQLQEHPDNVEWRCHFGKEHGGSFRYIIHRETDKWSYINMPYDTHGLGAHTAKSIWNLICQQAWRNGEPGLIFIDEIHRKNGENINATNPCGEQPLEDYEACCLGSINLSKFVTSPLSKKDPDTWDYAALSVVVRTGVDMLNQMINESHYPLDKVEAKVKTSRKIGLGVMGWADALIKRQIRYGSEESLAEAREVMSHIQNVAHAHSETMGYGNAAITTIAPTGSISIIAGCSSGIEPNYDWITKQHREDFEDQTVVHELARPYLDENYKPTEDMPDYFVTVKDITPTQHIDMQAAFQENIDNAVSKTINLSHDASEQDVQDAFMHAWVSKCKGVTVYRDGSRQDQVITRATQDDDVPKTMQEIAENALSWEEFTEQMGMPDERPYCLEGFTFKIPIDMGNKKVENAYLIVNTHEGNLYEVFLLGNIKEADPVVAQYIDTTTRLTSLALRGGIPLDKVVEQLEKVPCSYIYSIPHKIARILREFLPDDTHDPCPECGEKAIFSEGCEKCTACHWSRCG